MSIQYYETKQAAQVDVDKALPTWPGARIHDCGGGEDYIIIMHDNGCVCGSCPIVQTSGYVEA